MKIFFSLFLVLIVLLMVLLFSINKVYAYDVQGDDVDIQQKNSDSVEEDDIFIQPLSDKKGDEVTKIIPDNQNGFSGNHIILKPRSNISHSKSLF